LYYLENVLAIKIIHMTVEDIQGICKKLPSVTEDVKWEHDLVFSIGGKMFCVVGLDQTPTTASFKVRDDQFEEVCTRDGFKPAPYVAKYKWVWIDDIKKMDKKEWQEFVKQSYDLVKEKLPAKTKKQLGLL
jgi:predicted DNA-binding protein (MmcQ/YjbR family)